MQLAIAQNPHTTDPQALWNSLAKEEEPTEYSEDDELDKSGFLLLKQQISQQSMSGIAVK